jgi:hypothetical protein
VDGLTGSRFFRAPAVFQAPAILGAVIVALCWAVVPAEAQSDRERLQSACTAGAASAAACLDGVVSVEALVGGLGTALSLGSEFPGSASTLGRRYGATPRVATSLRLGIADVRYPAIGGAGTGASSWIPSLEGAVAVGVFDGFRPRATVGGVLAIDLMATAGMAFLPDGGGFGGAQGGFGYGIRLGLVRESFSLPGLTLSVVRRHGGGAEWNGVGGGLPDAVRLDGLTNTSVRASIGREFRALGIQAGMGWDAASADGAFTPVGSSTFSFDGYEADRRLFFGGVTATWLVVQFHGELAYAGGGAAAPEGGGTDFDPSAGSLMGALAFRLLF